MSEKKVKEVKGGNQTVAEQEGVLVPQERWEMYKEAMEVLKQIDKIAMVSYHLERFKHKYRQEFK